MIAIVIGTRGSELALKQTEQVKIKLQKACPEVEVRIEIIKTEGDKNMSPIPEGTVGKQWFTKEIERALIDGSIDLAVHSLKDLSNILPAGLTIGGIVEREDPRDVLISRNRKKLMDLVPEALIGTDSARRRAQVLALRPDLRVQSIRGNVGTRIEKMKRGDYDAVILAAAGLKRLGLEDEIAEYFDADVFVPAPGQGALVVEMRLNAGHVYDCIRKIADTDAEICVGAERAFSFKVGGGCKTPVGAYATLKGDKLLLTGMIGKTDGSHIIREHLEGVRSDGEKLGVSLAKRILAKCTPDMLELTPSSL